MMNSVQDRIALQNGVQLPCVGYGTWRVPDSDTAVRSVETAIAVGYRHIDTAAIYQNEISVGKAVRNSGVDRSQLFVTSKVWNTERGYEKTMAAFEETLGRLGMDYLDLYLIHWPATKGDWQELNRDTWRALEELYETGKVRAIGVSNFLVKHLEPLMADAKVKPMVDQIEFHPGYMQKETLDYCQKNGVQVEAWSPLARGRVFGEGVLFSIAKAHGKSVAQVCLRWCLQNGVVPLPKSVTPERIKENAELFDFELTAEEMEKINAMPQAGWSGHHPDLISF